MMLIGGVFSFIGDSIQEILVGIFLLIDSLVYTIIGWFYQLFLVLASFRLFENDMYKTITSSVYVVIGIVLLFILAYELLKMMVDPDKSKGTETIKKIILNLVSSMVMFAIVPLIFTFLFDFQNSVLSNNVLGKMLLPTYNSAEFNSALKEYDVENDGTISESDYNYFTLKYYGNNMANQLFQAFFYPTNANIETFSTAASEIHSEDNGGEWLTSAFAYGSCGLAVAGAVGVSAATALIGSPSFGVALTYCATVLGVKYGGEYIADMLSSDYSLEAAYNTASIYGDFSVFQKFSTNIIDNEITYHYLLSTIMGLVVVYILAIYCIDLGVRAVKLAFYEIIAPIPIFLRVIPQQEKVFNNWMKLVFSTYLEVFMRMFILYLGVFFISCIPSIMNNVFAGNSAYSENIIIYLLVRAILIIGILIFVKQMPKLIEEVTGIKSGNFSLNILDHIKDAAWAPSAVGGLIAGGYNPLAMIRAGVNGWKNNNLTGIGAEVTRTRNLQLAKENGSTFRGRLAERGRRLLGLETGVEKNERTLTDGYDLDGNVITAENDTNTEIKIKDENGNIIRTIVTGGNIAMDRNTQEDINRTLDVNARDISSIELESQKVSDAMSSNKGVISEVDKIEEKARKKYATSDIKVAIDLGDGLQEYNHAELESLIDTLQNSVGNYSEKKETVSYLQNALNNIHTNGEIDLDIGNGIEILKYNDIVTKIQELNNSSNPDVAKITKLQNALNNFDSMAKINVDTGNGEFQRLNSDEINSFIDKLNVSIDAAKIRERQAVYLGRVSKEFEAKGWEKYADAALRGRYEQLVYDLKDMQNMEDVSRTTMEKTASISNEDIEGYVEVLKKKLENGELFKNARETYSQDEIDAIVSGLEGFNFIDKIKGTAKEINRDVLALANEDLLNEKAKIKSQNEGLKRLLSELKEQQDIARRSQTHVAKKSDVNAVNNQETKGKGN